MALHSKRSNFWTGHDLKPALNINLDGIYLVIFLLGTAIIMGLRSASAH
jgi:hypothetical protein